MKHTEHGLLYAVFHKLVKLHEVMQG
jgi:hypothetical protein